MRWFRVPAFSGIQAAADDADRGTLRIAEGCLPVGTGGLHSGPVWETIGTADSKSSDENNILTGVDDDAGNSILLASRFDQVHDVKVFPVANTDLLAMDPSYDVSVGTLYNKNQAYLSAVGNRLIAFGDGTSEALFAGQGSPISSSATFPDAKIYHLEYSRFPNCRFFVVGPHKTLFAGGNPANPLTIYISEPAGLTQPERDSLYSLEATSSVNLLMTDASEVTALSCVAGNVAVHTDAGIFLLSPPTPDQASTGYRVEQAPTSVASAAVNLQVVAGEDGTQPYYLGFDGQIWKDPQGPGCEQKATYTDPVQASAGAKGRWDVEHPTDLSNSFAAYEPEIGQYWVYVESDEWKEYVSITYTYPPFLLGGYTTPEAPTNLSAQSAGNIPTNLSATTTPNAPWVLDGYAAPEIPTDLAGTTKPPAPTGLDGSTTPEIPTNLLALPALENPTDLSGGTAANIPTDLSGGTAANIPTDLSGGTTPNIPTGLDGAAATEIPTGLDGVTVPNISTGLDGATTPNISTGLGGASATEIPSGLDGATTPNISTGLDGATTPNIPTGLDGATTPNIPTGLGGASATETPTGLDGATTPNISTGLDGATTPNISTGLDGATTPNIPTGLGGASATEIPTGLDGVTEPNISTGLDGTTTPNIPTSLGGEELVLPAILCGTFFSDPPTDFQLTTTIHNGKATWRVGTTPKSLWYSGAEWNYTGASGGGFPVFSGKNSNSFPTSVDNPADAVWGSTHTVTEGTCNPMPAALCVQIDRTSPNLLSAYTSGDYTLTGITYNDDATWRLGNDVIWHSNIGDGANSGNGFWAITENGWAAIQTNTSPSGGVTLTVGPTADTSPATEGGIPGTVDISESACPADIVCTNLGNWYGAAGVSLYDTWMGTTTTMPGPAFPGMVQSHLVNRSNLLYVDKPFGATQPPMSYWPTADVTKPIWSAPGTWGTEPTPTFPTSYGDTVWNGPTLWAPNGGLVRFLYTIYIGSAYKDIYISCPKLTYGGLRYSSDRQNLGGGLYGWANGATNTTGRTTGGLPSWYYTFSLRSQGSFATGTSWYVYYAADAAGVYRRMIYLGMTATTFGPANIPTTNCSLPQGADFISSTAYTADFGAQSTYVGSDFTHAGAVDPATGQLVPWLT